jgi:hypothetical protein
MKRHLVALAIGSLFAAPALANNEIDPGYASPTTFVNDNAGWVLADAEQGHVVDTMQEGGKSRAEVQAEIVEARSSGEYIVNAELGTTAKQML